MACPFFPEEGLVYIADIDLTRFGPWYFGTDGDIDALVRSSRALLALDAEWYLTGHEEGLTDHGVLNPTRYHVDPWVRMWDTLGTRKHVARLRARGLVGRR